MIFIIIFIIVVIIFLFKKDNKEKINTTIIPINSSFKEEEEETIKINDKNFFLNNKIGYFSQAKTKDDAIYISNLVMQKEEKKLRWTELKKLILEKIPDYNIDLLESECSNFVAMAINFEMWKTIQNQKKRFPYIKYSSVIDGVTCKTCKKLDGIVRPVDDIFWDTYYPPNCSECRCLVLQYDEFDIKKPTDLSKKKLILPIEKFALNVGKHELKLSY
jgi:SPP1 gp7 family putative phage head morphogenesis protein